MEAKYHELDSTATDIPTHAEHTTSAHRLSLLDLPTEIWIRICELAVIKEEYIGRNVYLTNDIRAQVEQPAITRTCRLLRHEVLPIFYRSHTFEAGCIPPSKRTYQPTYLDTFPWPPSWVIWLHEWKTYFAPPDETARLKRLGWPPDFTFWLVAIGRENRRAMRSMLLFSLDFRADEVRKMFQGQAIDVKVEVPGRFSLRVIFL